MFGLIAAGLGLAGSLISGNKKNKQARRASDQSMGLQQEQLDFAKKRYEENKVKYAPIEKGMLQMALKPREVENPDYEGATSRAIGDVNSQFEGAEDARLRTMQRQGVNPNSGRAASMGRQLSLSRGLALAGGINQSRTQEKTRVRSRNDMNEAKQWDRLQNTATLGANKQSGASSALANSQGALAQTYQNRSNQASKQASGLFESAGTLAGGMLSTWGNK